MTTCFFFFNDTATTEIYTLSLHDALPISENSTPDVPAATEQPTVIVLYGGTGDLAKRLVLPAFWELYTRDLLPKRWKLVGNGRGDVSHEDFQQHVHDALAEFASTPDPDLWPGFAENILFAGGGFRDSNPGTLLDVLAEVDEDLGEERTLIHYLAIP